MSSAHALYRKSMVRNWGNAGEEEAKASKPGPEMMLFLPAYQDGVAAIEAFSSL
jgi:hypothetical protein